MPEAPSAPHRHVRPLALALVVVAAAGAGLESRSSETEERIAWQHAALELFLASVGDAQDHARIELCVRTRPGLSEGTTSVGFPRYRAAGGRWVDGVIAGVDRSRALRASSASGPACFTVLVAREATKLDLPIGGETLELDIDGWLEALSGDAGPTLQAEDAWDRDAVPIESEPEPTARTAAAAPEVVLVDDPVVDGVTLPIERERIVSVRLRARNVGQGAARDLVAWIEPGTGISPAGDGAARIDLGDLDPGADAEFVYRCYADRRAEALSFQVTFDDAASAAGGNASVVSLPLANSGPPPTPFVSDVDRTVPRAPRPRPAALAVVLGVEMYAEAPPATYAAADARTAAQYFERALGIPPERIEMLLDREVTLGQLQRIFGADGWLARRIVPDSEIFVFFAGHGMAEMEKFAPYLLPADADPDYLRQTAFPLDRMIEMLAALGARRTTLFLDACFGGLSRDGAALLDRARPLVFVQTQPEPRGISVFSAGSGSQVASALDAEGHGLFSYYLFKGLGGTADLDQDRRIVAVELKSYLDDAIPRAAQALDREQFPGIALDDPDHLLVELP